MRNENEIEQHIVILYASLEAFKAYDMETCLEARQTEYAIATLMWVLEVRTKTEAEVMCIKCKSKYFDLYDSAFRSRMEEIANAKTK